MRTHPFDTDPYFRESYAELTATLPAPRMFCHSHTSILLKPDAVVARRLITALDWLDDHGFRFVAAERVSLTRHTIRALWRTHWGSASQQRLWLADLLATATDSLVVLLHDDIDVGIPASVRLTELKGPTDPDSRIPGQLRHALGQHSWLLNQVHSPDDPADLIRELGIHFERDTLASWYRAAAMGADASNRAYELAFGLYADTTEHSLSVPEALDGLDREAAAVLSSNDIDPVSRTELLHARRRNAAELVEVVLRRGLPFDRWNVIVAGADLLPMTHTGKE